MGSFFSVHTNPHMSMFTHLCVSTRHRSGKSSHIDSGKCSSSHPFWEREMVVIVFNHFMLWWEWGFPFCVVDTVMSVWHLCLWYCVSALSCCENILTCVCYWHASSRLSVFVRVYSCLFNMSRLCNVYILIKAGSCSPSCAVSAGCLSALWDRSSCPALNTC